MKYSLAQSLKQDVNAREVLVGGTHTPRCILNAVNGALWPHKHARHERKADLFMETGLKQTGGCQHRAKVNGKRETGHNLTVKAN